MSWQEIPGWMNFEPEYKEAVCGVADSHRGRKPKERRQQTFVEVGVAFGRSIACMARLALDAGFTRGGGIRIIGVDPFLEIMGQDQPDKRWIGQKYENARAAFEGFMGVHAREERELIELMQCSSLEAANSFPDHSLDLVWIDASHEYEHVSADIEAWLPKVRAGGTLGGDDYDLVDYPGVIRAVRETFAPYGYAVRGRAWKVVA
ncbi:MAG TPA: class I SAM-dependent methyltransferase [Polyangiaceae bacterium]|nr:class I SAM-dependent methyltransferase [Polyangiaceae bacterium]